MKILMVCLGNICRSPLAEALLEQKADKAGLVWQVDSAGTNGFHNGEAPHRLSQKVARHYGLNISQQRSRQLTKDDFVQYHRIYAMAKEVFPEMKYLAGSCYNSTKVELLMNELKPGANLDIPDPWYGGIDGYYEVFDMINAACDALINNYLTTVAATDAFLKQPYK